MKVKDLEERLQKSEADRGNVEEQLGEIIRQKARRLEELEQSLGHRSSYASKAAESARALVEMTEGQKRQLQCQLEDLVKEQVDVKKQLNDMVCKCNALDREVKHLRGSAVEEARATTKADLDALQEDNFRLKGEKTQLQLELEKARNAVSTERGSRRMAEEKVKRLEQKVPYI